jgi:Tol biopolymer transport system component
VVPATDANPEVGMNMLRAIVAPVMCLAAAMSSFGSGRATALEQSLPWAVGKPVPQPILFAEGVISTRDDEMDTSFSPDGKTVYFTRNHIGQRLGVILESHYQDGRWSAPEVASFSGRFTDYDPFISPDGSKLFFASNRPTSGSAKKDFDIWFVEKDGQGWTAPKSVGAPVNSPQDEFYPTVAADGTLYFSATRSDSHGRSDIYLSRWKDGQFATPENLGPGVNSPAQEVDSYVAADQSFIIFAGFGRPDDLGNGDLYISERVNGQWLPARHLGAGVNSSAREYCPAASPDGKYFFFTSFRGFGDRVPDKPWTYRDFRAGMDSVLNGFGNIYQVDMAAVRNAPR